MEQTHDIKVWPYNLIVAAFGLTSYNQYNPLKGIDDPVVLIQEACNAFIKARKQYGGKVKNKYGVDSEASARRFCEAVFAVYRDGMLPYVASKECHISSRTYNLNIDAFLNTLRSMVLGAASPKRRVGLLKYGDISSMRREAFNAIQHIDTFRNMYSTLDEMSDFLTDHEVCSIQEARKALSRAITHLDTIQNIEDARR